MSGQQLALLGRTAVHLQPSQAAHRARLRAQRAALGRWPELGRRLLRGPAGQAGPGWPAAFVPVDAWAPEQRPSLTDLQAGQLELLGTRREIGDPACWEHADAPQLWRFHLHYWDWAWGLAADPDLGGARAQFARLWRSWQATVQFGRGDAWLPYPAALRAWSWCGLHAGLVAGTSIEAEFRDSLAAHAAFLRRHLEADVGGNHLIKDLKALTGLAVFFGDEPLLQRALRLLASQLTVQVLADGGHYERAPAYHCQVLADLIDIDGLLGPAGYPAAPGLAGAISAMQGWLGELLTPVGTVPMLNDGYPVPAGVLTAVAPRVTGQERLLVLADSGLIRAQAGDWHLLADVGPPCPDELPAHAHADTLGCVVHFGGQPMLVDTGTSTYQPGPARGYERSTAAHNTVEVDGTDSTEVWGAFRAGRRARVQDVQASDDGVDIVIEAEHDGYRWLPGRPCHRRRWLLGDAGLAVQDLVTGRGRHVLTIRWHLPAGSSAQPVTGGALVTTPAGTFRVGVTTAAAAELSIGEAPVADGFQQTAPAPVLAWRIDARLPVSVSTTWREAGPGDLAVASADGPAPIWLPMAEISPDNGRPAI
ncbi:MAG: alginate lyase family protein [Actinomycetota bacterium]